MGFRAVDLRPNIAPRQLALVEMDLDLDARKREVLRHVQHGRSDGIPAGRLPALPKMAPL
jgi:hypothetical protein